MRLISCVSGVVSVLGLFAACGDDGPTGDLADAPIQTDARSDGGGEVDASGIAPVKVTIIDGNGPVIGAKVYFQNADSTLVAVVPTNAIGVASAVLDAGGYVTVVDVLQNRTFLPVGDLQTFAGVKPGDSLHIDQRFGAPGVNVSVTVPDQTGAVTYRLHTTCSGSPIDLPTNTGSAFASAQIFLQDCNTGDFLVEALDDAGAPNGFLYAPNVTVVDGGTLDITGTYTTPVNRAFHYKNPAPYNFLTFQNFLASSRGIVRATGDSIGFEGNEDTRSLTIPPAEPLLASITHTQFEPLNQTFQQVIGWGPSTTDEYLLDGTTAILPTFDTSPSWDQATGSLVWTQTAGPVTPDLVVARASFDRQGEGLFWTWTIAAPFGTTSLKFPTLPAEVAHYNPRETDGSASTQLALIDVTGGYDAIRGQIINAVTGSTGLTSLIVGPTGQTSIATAFQNNGKRPAARRTRPAIFR